MRCEIFSLRVFCFASRKLKDNKVCITPLHTSKVCNIFFGGVFSHTYLLKGVHFGTLAERTSGISFNFHRNEV